MNIRQIEAFKAVMEHGTVIRAAEVMHISQPAVTKLLQAFERAAGFRVFDRIRGRLTPTPEGLALYREVERVFVAAGEIRLAAEEIRVRRFSSLAVGAMPALSSGFVQQVALRFLRSSPDVGMTVRTTSTVTLIDMLASSKLDIAFCNSAHEHPEVQTELLSREPLVCVLPPKHRLAAKTRITAKDLEGESFIGWGPGSMIRTRIDTMFEKLGVSRRQVFSTSTAPALCAFVANDLGVALVHPLYIGTAAKSLAVRPFEPGISLDIFMAFPRHASRPDVVRKFAETALKEARVIERQSTRAASQ